MENQIFRQDGGQLLNSWFVGIMWVKIVFSVLGIIGQVWHMFSDITSANPIVVISVVLAVCAVTGGYWLLGAEKKGFYMIVGANISHYMRALLRQGTLHFQFCYLQMDLIMQVTYQDRR